MTIGSKKPHPALRHAGYSVTTILPGEDAAEFAKLHRDLISEWTRTARSMGKPLRR